MDISIVTPAHDEEKYIGKCLDSVSKAIEHSGLEVEHIVVLNRCTDRTEQMAIDAGCRIVHEDARILARIRNAGAAVAKGRILITIDADSWMSSGMLSEVVRMIGTGKYVGGGVKTLPERWSPGIFCSVMVIVPFIIWHRLRSAGMFWCLKTDFDAIGGFDETMVCVEDVDFAKRLRQHGRSRKQTYGTIRKEHIKTSCRKFDQFGDWCLVRNPKLVYDLFNCRKESADKFYYDADR